MNKKIQLFCLPYAGGSASAFSELCGLLKEEIEAVAIEYPGRGTRRSEPLCESMDELICDAESLISEKRDRSVPFALLGYSMGVDVAFDLAQYALKEKPAYIFFAAREAICYNSRGHDYALYDMKEFTERIYALGGINEKIYNNKRFLEAYMRPIYADYKLLNQYVFKCGNSLPECDMTVFYCEKDTPLSKISDWKNYTFGKVSFYELGDNHFFIQQHADKMADVINSELSRVCGLL